MTRNEFLARVSATVGLAPFAVKGLWTSFVSSPPKAVAVTGSGRVTDTYRFSYKKWVLSVSEVEDATNFRIRLDARNPSKLGHVTGDLTFDDNGLLGYDLKGLIGGSQFASVGERKRRGLHVSFTSDGDCQGALMFDTKSYDITTFDLLALDESDVKRFKSGTKLRVLDLVEAEIYEATVTSEVRDVDGRSVRYGALDFGDDKVEFVFDCKTSELAAARVAGHACAEISEQEWKEAV